MNNTDKTYFNIQQHEKRNLGVIEDRDVIPAKKVKHEQHQSVQQARIKPSKCSASATETIFAHTTTCFTPRFEHQQGGHIVPEPNDLIFHEVGNQYELVPYHSITDNKDIRCIYTFPLKDDNNKIVQVAIGQTSSNDVVWKAKSNMVNALLEIKNDVENVQTTSTSCGSLKDVILTTNWYADVQCATRVPKLYASSFKVATHLKFTSRYWLDSIYVLGTMQHVLKFIKNLNYVDTQFSLIPGSVSEENVRAMGRNRYKLNFNELVGDLSKITDGRIKYVCQICREVFHKRNEFKHHMAPDEWNLPN